MIILLLILSVSQALCNVWMSQCIGQMIDLIPQQHKETHFFIFLLFYFLIILITVFSQYWMQKIANSLSYQSALSLRKKAQHQLIKAKQQTRDYGTIAQLLTNEVESITQATASLSYLCFAALPQLIITLIFMWKTNIPLMCVVLALAPLMIIIMRLIAQKSKHTFINMQQYSAEMTEFSQEYLQESQLLNFFNYDDTLNQQFQDINQQFSQWSKKAQWLSSLTNPLSRFIDHIIYLSLAYIASIVITPNHVGIIYTFILYATQFTKPFIELTSLSTQYQTAKTCYQRYTQWVNELKLPNLSHKGNTPSLSGDICFQHVDFAYRYPLFHNLTLRIPYKKKVAIIGPTGAGKSTLIQLLLKLDCPQQGEITINDHSLSKMDTSYLRQHIGVVFQEPWIYTGTLRENLCLYKDAPDDVLWDSLKKVDLFHICHALPQKLDTVIDSTFLSKGEQQLLSIARLFVAQQEIIILDEATSALDEVTEHKITKALNTLTTNKTVIMIAHHLSTIDDVDYIFTLDHGHLIEQGTPEQLLMYNSYYRHLKQLQGE